MKLRLLSVFMWVVFTSGLMNSTLLLFNFALNQETISEVFCVNKEKPQLKCNGKCHLSKKLNETKETNSNKNTPPEYHNLSEFITVTEDITITTACRIEVPQFKNRPTSISEGYEMIDIPPPRIS